jgi:hypothetical protein
MEKRFRLPRKEKKRRVKWYRANNIIFDWWGLMHFKYYSKNK